MLLESGAEWKLKHRVWGKRWFTTDGIEGGQRISILRIFVRLVMACDYLYLHIKNRDQYSSLLLFFRLFREGKMYVFISTGLFSFPLPSFFFLPLLFWSRTSVRFLKMDLYWQDNSYGSIYWLSSKHLLQICR